MSAPLVSVLMTAYNREKYIAEAIESVRRKQPSRLRLRTRCFVPEASTEVS